VSLVAHAVDTGSGAGFLLESFFDFFKLISILLLREEESFGEGAADVDDAAFVVDCVGFVRVASHAEVIFPAIKVFRAVLWGPILETFLDNVVLLITAADKRKDLLMQGLRTKLVLVDSPHRRHVAQAASLRINGDLVPIQA